MEYGGRLDDDDAKMNYIEVDDRTVALKDDMKLTGEDTSMEFEYNDEQDASTYEVWLTNELLAMNVNGDTRELRLRKATFLNISDELGL